MQKETHTKAQQLNDSVTDPFWNWRFSAIDWIAVVGASALFLAIVGFLFYSPVIVERSGMIPSAPLFGIPIICAVMVFKPRSNTNRIPAAYIGFLSLVVIALNWALL